MKDEIKEILNKLKDTADTSFFAVCGSQEELDKMPRSITKILSIPSKDAKILLDYITNLQKENERLKYLLDDNNSIKAFVIEHNKVDKAIELLKEAGCYDEETKTFCDDIWEELPKLLNILNGGDDNE